MTFSGWWTPKSSDGPPRFAFLPLKLALSHQSAPSVAARSCHRSEAPLLQSAQTGLQSAVDSAHAGVQGTVNGLTAGVQGAMDGARKPMANGLTEKPGKSEGA